MHSMAYSYHLGVQTVSICIEETCRAIEKHMMHQFLPKPTEDTWRNIERGFQEKWQFPNCIGALDGKHISITAPPKSGSLFFNCKGTFSIVLLALVDAHYRFTCIPEGDFGKASDGGTYKIQLLAKSNTLLVPPAKCLPGAEKSSTCLHSRCGLPTQVVSHEAFSWKKPVKAEGNIQLSSLKSSYDSGKGLWNTRCPMENFQQEYTNAA